MKKHIFMHWLLLFLFVLSLFSCTTPPETFPESSGNSSSENVYTDSSDMGFLIVNSQSSTPFNLYKLYLDEGIFVPLCPDPLCSHNSNSCPFNDVNPTVVNVGNTLYYLRTKSSLGNFQSICKYDMDENKFEVLYTVERNASILSFDVHKNQIFFFTQKKSEDSKYLMYLMKLDIKSKKATQLSEKSEADRISLFGVENDRYYWFDYSTSGYFSTDADYKNRIENDKIANARNRTLGKHFETKVGGAVNGRPYITVTELGRNGAEDKVIIEKSGIVPAFYNGNIIYTKLDEKILVGNEFKDGKEKPVYDYSGGKYYICDTDGNNERLLCDISGNNCAIITSCTVYGDYTGVDDYIALKVDCYKTTEKGYIEKENLKYVVINIVTGEYKIVGVD